MKIVTEQLQDAIKEIDQKYFERKERDFTYEFYHQIRLLKLTDNLEVTCETGKKRFNFNDNIFKNELIYRNFFRANHEVPNYIYRSPDLLIHEFENRNQQLIAFEIKKNPTNIEALKDLSKLVAYCRGNLKYKKGILLLFNFQRPNLIDVPDIKKLLKKYQEVEIWIIRPKRVIEIISSETINK